MKKLKLVILGASAGFEIVNSELALRSFRRSDLNCIFLDIIASKER